jgi:hypothetical protein
MRSVLRGFLLAAALALLPSFASAQSASNAIAASQVSIGTSATLAADARPTRSAVTIENTGTTAVYIGTSDVTTTTGMLLPGVVGASITINSRAPIYGVVATGTATVTILDTY